MTKIVTVIGLGYVGLPLTKLLSSKGYSVKGYDINSQRLEKIRSKDIIIDDTYAQGKFNSSNLDISDELKSSDIYVVCVPTPVDSNNKPNLYPIISAVNKISEVLKDDQLIIIESTVYPGLCEEVVYPILNKTGKRFFLSHCPERINPGDKKWNVSNISRVVGGFDAESLKRTADFYRSVLNADVFEVSSIRNAEATKILENIFRDVNLALVNEMSQSFYRMDIDIKEVIDAAATKPFSFMPHFPGVGVGGHCIAVDPYYMIEKGRAAGFDHELLRTSRKINSNMPIYTVYLIQNVFNSLELPLKNRNIGVYGLAYKPNVSDTRESPSFEIIKRLKELKEAKVHIYDPHVPEFSTEKSMDDFLKKSEAIIICTAHDEIVNLKSSEFKKHKVDVVIDGRNCRNKKEIVDLGIVYKGIGRN